MTTDRQAQVDAFMEKLSPRWRYRWCEPKPDDWCGCLGCVNGSGRIKPIRIHQRGLARLGGSEPAITRVSGHGLEQLSDNYGSGA